MLAENKKSVQQRKCPGKCVCSAERHEKTHSRYRKRSVNRLARRSTGPEEEEEEGRRAWVEVGNWIEAFSTKDSSRSTACFHLNSCWPRRSAAARTLYNPWYSYIIHLADNLSTATYNPAPKPYLVINILLYWNIEQYLYHDLNILEVKNRTFVLIIRFLSLWQSARLHLSRPLSCPSKLQDPKVPSWDDWH